MSFSDGVPHPLLDTSPHRFVDHEAPEPLWPGGPRRRRGRPRRTRLRLLLALALSSATAIGAPPTPTEAAGPPTISGRITKTSGGAVANARVEATTADGRVTFTATADSNGAYSIEVEPGTYCVSFGAREAGTTTTAYNGVRHCLDGALRVTVGSTTSRAGIDGVLHLGEVSGVVVDGQGAPVVGAVVYLNQVGGTGHTSAVTGAGGAFLMRDVVPGTHCVSAFDYVRFAMSAGGDAGCTNGGRRLDVLADTPVGGVDIALGPPLPAAKGSISGRVTTAGAPVANRYVQVHGPTGDYATVSTNAAGAYTVDRLAPGAYCVRVEIAAGSSAAAEAYPGAPTCSTGQPVVVGAGPVTGIDLDLGVGGTIRGTVTSGSATPLQSAGISIRSFDAATPVADTWTAQTATVGGAYEIAGVPPGDYCVTFIDQHAEHAPEAFPNAPSCTDRATPVHVSRGSTAVVDAQLTAGGSITGVVSVPAGQTASDVVVIARGPMGASPLATPDGTGRYTIANLAPGLYCLSFRTSHRSDMVNSTAFSSDPNGCNDGSGTLPVTEGGLSGGDTRMDLGGSISGWVTTASGQAVGEAYVQVSRPDVAGGFDRSFGETNGTRYDGSFRVRGIPAGTYCVTFSTYTQGLGTTVFGDAPACSSPLALPVTVRAGENLGNLHITPLEVGYISGSVAARDGRDLRGTTVQLFAAGSTAPTATYDVYDARSADLADRADEPRPAGEAASTFVYHGAAAPGTYCVKIVPPAGSGLAVRAFPAAPDCGQGSTPVTIGVASYTAGIDVVLEPRSGSGGGTGGGADGGAGAVYVPLAEPRRLADTRAGQATVDGVDAGAGRLEPGAVHEVVVAGRAGVPAGAASVGLNVTAVDAAAPGFVTVWPCGAERPLASNVNYAGGGTRPNAVIAKVGIDGKVCMYSSQALDLVVDVAGYFPTADGFTPLTAPGRLTDTRTGQGTVDGVDAGGGRVAGGAVHEVPVAGRSGVPTSAATAVLNVTAVDASAAGFVTVWPCGVDRPLASNVNFAAGDTRPNSVIAKVGADGKVCVYASQSIDVVVDVAGFFPTADGFVPLSVPSRLTDTRPGSGTVDGVDAGAGRVGAGDVHEVVVAGRGGVPAGAATAVLNVTAVDASAPGFVTVWPCGVERPLASNVNFGTGETSPNSVIAKVGTDGKVCVFSSQPTDVVIDVAGYFPQ